MSPQYLSRSFGAVFLAFGLWLGASTAFAHGIWAHVHVTGWAVENLPDGQLRSFFSEHEVMNAVLFGAAFTDSGYFPQAGALRDPAHAYSEHTHWEPFIESFIQWIRKNDPPPWTELASKKRVAFLMGCAAHGFQDELFDTLFLEQIAEHDDGSQDNADPGSDGFLADAGLLRFAPTEYIPMDTLLELYADLEHEVTADVIERSVKMMTTLYLNEGPGRSVAQALDAQYAEELPWMKAHFLDPAIPGSLRSEILPTGAYLEAIWARLHGDFNSEEVVVFGFPESARTLLSGVAGSTDSWVTLVYGAGVHRDSAEGQWLDEAGEELPFDLAATRWGATYSRLQRFIPTEDLAPGSKHKVVLKPGLELVGGEVTQEAWEFELQVACAETGDPGCPDQDNIPAAALDGSGPPDFSAQETVDPELSEAAHDQDESIDSEGCSLSRTPGHAAPGFALVLLALLLWLRATRRRVSIHG